MVPSASLIPENDPTVLFTTAGMHPLVPYLLGEKHPAGKRLADVQKCVRTGDIDAVGDAWHLTFFEMLGNWSLGDYFKEEAIGMAWEFLTSKKWLGIDSKRLSVSVFAGDQDAPRDSEAAQIWAKQGIPKERIYYYPKSENWWGPAGETGPCGPDTEIFFDTLKSPWKKPHQCEPKCECGRFAEIWNLVFMEYEKKRKAKSEKRKTEYDYIRLEQKNVDTGMGMERTIAVLNGKDNVYATDLFEPIIEKIKNQRVKSKMSRYARSGEARTEQNSEITEEMAALRIIADHLRASVFILADGVTPSNKDQGYVLRRLIRRAIRKATLLGITRGFTTQVAGVVIERFQEIYPELQEKREVILNRLLEEEKKFSKPLNWLEQYKIDLREAVKHKEIKKIKDVPILSAPDVASGRYVYENFQSYGVPPDLSEEVINELGLKYDRKEFEQAFLEHQNLSRTATQGKFRGGLADAKEITIKYHTATHLLHQALRQVLGDHVEQRGSNINPERLRFDFSHSQKLTPEELSEVAQIVNSKIQEGIPVKMEEMSVDEAKKLGAIGLFEHKYGDRVKVYSIGTFSKEICGGPHVKNTKELGKFKIIKEEASSAGVRRIKAKLLQ